MKKMYVQPTSGLCNRMRVIASAYEVAQKTGKQMILVWEMNSMLNCDFTRLFSLPDDIMAFSYGENEYGKRLQLFAVKTVYFLSGRLYKKTDILNATNNKSVYDKMYLSDVSFYLETCYGLRGSYEKDTRQYDYSIFKFNADVIQKCPQELDQGQFVGVHVRRTDHVTSILESPLEVFYEKMDEEINENNHIRFFLATDSKDVICEMKERYSDRIVTNDSVLSRDTQEGIEDAMVELVALSRCQKVLGSTWSSFSTAAAVIGNIPLIVCTKESNVGNTQ